MTCKIGILALVALQAFTASALPPCVCTRNLRPICGSDGKTYANECILNCEKDKGATELTIDKEGPCQAAAPSCICTLEYKPVCGNDGNTYPNRCSLMCKRSANPDIDVVSESSCSDKVKVAEPPCICTEGLNYVCGSDGNTYDNACVLNCATAKDSKLSINHQGRCNDAVKVAEPLCFCTDDLRPVCGSDGNTYDNACALNCATAKDSKLSINHQGRCNDAVKVAEPLCFCTDDLRPVCGSDGNTYDNACALNCATAKDPGLSIKQAGKCEDSFQVLNPVIGDHPSCSCPRNIKPVCGSDGNTYQNACLLECAGGEVTLARHAPCYARS